MIFPVTTPHRHDRAAGCLLPPCAGRTVAALVLLAAFAGVAALADAAAAQVRLPPGLVAVKGARTEKETGLPFDVKCKADGAEMVLVPAGTFPMGDDHLRPIEAPRHEVYVSAFYIDKYEVTNERYQKFLEATGHDPPPWWYDEKLNQPNQPVVGASWEDASAYCRWAGKTLPTEAEWEKAARGTDGRAYPWGNEPVAEGGKYRANYRPADDGFEYTAPVGSFPLNKSPYGCFDMAGNVWEWCADWYGEDYYKISPRKDPLGPPKGIYRVHRGGSYVNKPENLRCAFRSGFFRTAPHVVIGFRCVVRLHDR